MADSEKTDAPAAPPPPPPPPPATLGETLRVARLAQDLTIEQLSTDLRIEAKQLHALEENRFEQIGVPVFVKGYLKQYGLRLGLDVKDLLALYYKQTTLADVQIQPSRTIKLRDDRQITSWVLAAVVLLAVIGGLAAWWWSGGSFGSVLNPQSAPAATAPAVEPQRQTPPPGAPAVVPQERSLPAVDPTPQPAVAPGQPETVPAEIPAVAAVETAADDADDDEQRPPPVLIVPLQFSFAGESWAEVTDARGERLLFGLNTAGRDVTVRGEPPFAVILGDANAVRLTVDGLPYEIPTIGRQGNLVRFSVDISEE
jgi:cytoskeleton protein RodZ